MVRHNKIPYHLGICSSCLFSPRDYIRIITFVLIYPFIFGGNVLGSQTFQPWWPSPKLLRDTDGCFNA